MDKLKALFKKKDAKPAATPTTTNGSKTTTPNAVAVPAPATSNQTTGPSSSEPMPAAGKLTQSLISHYFVADTNHTGAAPVDTGKPAEPTTT